jgi:hypothetical protein
VLLTLSCFSLVMIIWLLLFRIIFRRSWIAVAALCLCFSAYSSLFLFALFGLGGAMLLTMVNIAHVLLMFFVLLRFGLLAFVSYNIFNGLMMIAPFTYDTSAPYFGTGLLVTLVAFALAAYGWKVSIAGRSLIQRDLLDS